MRRARVGAVRLRSASRRWLAQRGNPNPMDSIRKLPSYRPRARLDGPLLTPERIAKLRAGSSRGEWDAYRRAIARSVRARHRGDGARARAAGRSAMTRAPYTHDFSVKPYMTPAWFATRLGASHGRRHSQLPGAERRMVEARRLLAALRDSRARAISPRAPTGNGSRRSTTTRRRRRSTFSRARTARGATHDTSARSRAAIDYLLASQFPNGCFPQVYPLQGSYHDAVTFNDDATVNVLRAVARRRRRRVSRVVDAEQRTARARRGRRAASSAFSMRRFASTAR